MTDFWTQNREGLGINILASAIYGSGLYALWWIGKRTPSGAWRVAYVADAAVLASIACVYAFFPNPNAPVPSTVWKLIPWLGGVSFCVFLLFVIAVFIRPRNEPILPPTEEELNPLSGEAKSLLKAAMADPHLSFLGTFSGGQKGKMYNTNNGLIVCDGQDAIQSAKYDAAAKQLRELGYLNSTPSGQGFTLTAEGVARAEKL